MKNLILINTLLLLSIASFAQNYKFDWVRAFNSTSSYSVFYFKNLATDNELNVHFLAIYVRNKGNITNSLDSLFQY